MNRNNYLRLKVGILEIEQVPNGQLPVQRKKIGLAEQIFDAMTSRSHIHQ